jgi:hypothetical protein
MARKYKKIPQNRHAEIRSRIDRTGKLRTETIRRDEDQMTVAISTDTTLNSTNLYVDFPDGGLFKADGRTARTLYRALQKHYQATNKVW